MQREFKISLSQEFYSDIVYLSQYDSDYPVIFTVTDKYSKASGINGYTAKFTGTRGDGTGLGFTYTATAIGHTVSFTIDTMLTGVAGTHAGEIIFYDQNGLYFGTANVQIIVEPAARPDGTIDADEEELRDLAQQCQDIVDTAAAEVKGEAEAWAVGERDGEPVPSTDPTYHNNAKYYAEQAQDIADSIGIDATLSISGKAADAKKTGDEISSLKEDFNGLWQSSETNLNLENGTFSTSTGAVTSSQNRVTSGLIHLKKGQRITVQRNNPILMIIFGVFNAAKTSFSCPVSSSWALSDVDWTATEECWFIIQFRTNTNSDITPSDISSTCYVYTSYKYIVDGHTDEIEDINEEITDINKVIDGDYIFKEYSKSSSVWTAEQGYFAGSNGKVANSDYLLLEYTATRDFQIYCDPSMLTNTKTVFIAIYNDATIAAAKLSSIYRLTTTENTMPTSANKATVYNGQILTISIYTPAVDPRDIDVWANIEKDQTLVEKIDNKVTNFALNKKIAWFGDSISELKKLPHTTGTLLNADVYDCSIRGSTIGRTYSNYNEFSFYNLVTAIIAGDFDAQFDQLDAYEQAQGKTYPGIRENLTTLSSLDFDDVDYVVLLGGTNDFGITAVHAATGYDTKIDEMKARMDDAISRFITAYPKLKFYIISPPFRATPTEDYYGDTLADYVAAEQTVAEKHAIPFYNLLTHSRICAENKETYMNSDGGVYVHPNDYGDAWLAELCAKFISVN